MNKIVLMYNSKNDFEVGNYFCNKYPQFEVKECVLFDEIHTDLLEEMDREYYMVVVLGDDWKQIGEVLEEAGFSIFKNYIYEWMLEILGDSKILIYEKLYNYAKLKHCNMSEYLNVFSKEKKIAYLYGNCQMSIIAKMLLSNKAFSDTYYLVLSNPIHRLDDEARKYGIDSSFLRELSLFIYQYVKTSNKYSKLLSTEYLKSKLSEKCKQICIPNMFFSGYFPQYQEMYQSPLNDVQTFSNGLIPYGDRKLEESAYSLYNDEISFSDIIKQLYTPDLYEKVEVDNNFMSSLNELEEREKICDIKISDYVIENYQKERLFYTVNHPTNSLVKKMTERILSHLGFDETIVSGGIVEGLDEIEQMIYPSVKLLLNLKFDVETNALHKKYCDKKLSLKEYTATYIKECLYMQKVEHKDYNNNLLAKLCIYDDEYIRLRKKIEFRLEKRMAHLSMFFQISKSVLNDIVIWVPYKMAPDYDYISFCISILGQVCPITIDRQGNIRINMCNYHGDLDKDVFIIDLFYITKSLEA